jgi:hypothetical protein
MSTIGESHVEEATNAWLDGSATPPLKNVLAMAQYFLGASRYEHSTPAYAR